MTKKLNLIMILTAILICLLMLVGCQNGEGVENESSEGIESTTEQTTETSAQTSDKTSETTAQTSGDTTESETEGINIRPGTDSEHGWEEFNPA